MSEHLSIWDKTQQTDPSHTKGFSKGGGFKGTSINPTYNNKKATELFGPCGLGWGIDIISESFQEGAPLVVNGAILCNEVTHILRISLWYKWKGEIGRIPSVGQTTYVGSNKYGAYTDEEAPKKSQTDAITKALSMLGFSADVFLGMYDDVKYVNDMRENHSPKAKEAETKPVALTPEQKLEAAKKKAQIIIAEYKECKGLTSMSDVQEKYKDNLEAFKDRYPDLDKEINTVVLQVIGSFDR